MNKAEIKSRLFIADQIDKMASYAEMLETRGNIAGVGTEKFLTAIKESAKAIIEEIEELEKGGNTDAE